MAKEHPIDVEARENRALQDAARSKVTRVTELALVIAVSLLILSLGIAILALPQRTVSEEENRTLQTFPTFSLEALLSGDFTADVATFYADQFPLRDLFVACKGGVETLLLKGENNGVLVGKDGYLIDRLEYGDAEYGNIDANLLAVKRFEALAEEAEIPLTLAVAPRTVDVMTDAYPALYTGDRAAAARHRVTERYATAVDLALPLAKHAQSGEYVMFRTDHHWTPLGAYYAYCALGESLGYEPLALDTFTADPVSDAFYGTTYSKAGIKWAEPDALTLYRGDDDGTYTVTVHDSGDTRTGFYVDSFLSEKDKYGVFLGGNYGHVSIRRAGDGERPVLLVVKDSFALSVVPFLARHFDLELVDPRYFSGSTADLLLGDGETGGVDRVLVLVGTDTLASGSVLRRLLLGL